MNSSYIYLYILEEIIYLCIYLIPLNLHLDYGDYGANDQINNYDRDASLPWWFALCMWTNECFYD